MKLRFAANPAGLLHVGRARVALMTWLLARRNGGGFVLRIDDAEGGREDFAAAVEQDLGWLGLDWDGVVRQSERMASYEAAAGRLRESGRLYPCFESEEELAAKREQRQRRGHAAIYDRAMLKLTAQQRASAEAGGKRPYWRFMLSGVPAEWGDMVLGRQEVKLSAVSDPVMVRADGVPLPGFASVVDDVEMGVTHVVRGAEQAVATGVQIDVMAALGSGGRFGGQAVRFAHLPALAEGGGGKRGGVSLRSLRGDGVEAGALAGYLAGLGVEGRSETGMPAALAEGFDLSRVMKGEPRFDARRLVTMNRRALAALPFEAVRERLPAGATPAFWMVVRGGMDLLREARGWWDVVAGTIVPPLLEGEGRFLAAALEVLPEEPWDEGVWVRWGEAVRARTGRSGKSLTLPLRLALTGEERGPELGGLMPLMGRARVMERLRLATA